MVETFKENFQPISLKKDESDLLLIHDVLSKINNTFTLDEVNKIILHNIIKVTGVERAFILLKGVNDELEFKYTLDKAGEPLKSLNYKINNKAIVDVFKNKSNIAFTNNNKVIDDSLPLARSIFASALINEDKCFGILYADSSYTVDTTDERIKILFSIISEAAAAAYRNDKLYTYQVNAYNALNEANIQLIQLERQALKSSLDNETGQSLQELVHIAALETESITNILSSNNNILRQKLSEEEILLFDQVGVKAKVISDNIRNIQKFAQVLQESSIQLLNKNSTDINSSIYSVIKYLSTLNKFKNIKFNTEFKVDKLCKYDPVQIQQLLVQILVNVVQAKEDAEVKIITSCDSKNILVTISDNGPGIPKEIQKKVFDLPSPDKTGYGLFLCKSIIERHRGTIELLKTELGTTIQFTIPLT